MKYGYILCFCFLLNVSLVSQDTGDGSYYDQEDLEFLFTSIGIDIYKYPFTSNSNESLNIIIEEYKNGRKVQSIDFYQQFLPMFKVLKKSPGDFFPPMSDAQSSWLKFYMHNQDSLLLATIKTDMIEKKYSFDISGLKFTQSRTFDYVKTEIEERQPLFVFYGIEQGKLLSCPGDAQIKDILPMYNHVIVFYAEPFIIF